MTNLITLSKGVLTVGGMIVSGMSNVTISTNCVLFNTEGVGYYLSNLWFCELEGTVLPQPWVSKITNGFWMRSFTNSTGGYFQEIIETNPPPVKDSTIYRILPQIPDIKGEVYPIHSDEIVQWTVPFCTKSRDGKGMWISLDETNWAYLEYKAKVSKP